MTKELSKQRKRAEAERENHAFPGAVTCELSRQLCELCGITRKYCKRCGSRGYIGERYIKEDIFECCMCHCEDYEIKANSDIDFGQPENFVKLIKIWLSLFEEYRCWRHNMSFPIEEQLISDALYRCSDEYPTNRLKQQIREAEWKYE